MAEDIKIQPAEEKDFPYILEKLRKYILDSDNLSRKQFFVAKKSDKTIAFGRVINHKEYFEIASLGVDYYHRKKGIGARMLSFLLGEAKRLNKEKPVYIVTHMPDFFKKYGFEEIKNAPGALKNKKRAKCKLKPLKSKIMKFASV